MAMKQAHLDLLKNNLSARRITDTPTADKPAPPPPRLPESAGDAWRKSVGLPPVAGQTSDTAKQDERSHPEDGRIPGTSNARPDAFLDEQNRILATIDGFQTGAFQNRKSAAEIARDQQAAAWSPEAWERVIPPTLQGFSS